MTDDTDDDNPFSYEKEVVVNEHKAVGPVDNFCGHGPVTLVGDELVVCLDCGYTTDDVRQLAHEACQPSKNTITVTWREWLEEHSDVERLPTADDDGEWPIEE